MLLKWNNKYQNNLITNLNLNSYNYWKNYNKIKIWNNRGNKDILNLSNKRQKIITGIKIYPIYYIAQDL